MSEGMSESELMSEVIGLVHVRTRHEFVFDSKRDKDKTGQFCPLTSVQKIDLGIRIRRRSRERRSPVSEIVTDTPTICQRDTGQRGRSAMDTPRHEGTPYLIEVTSRPGKYELKY